MFNIDKIAILKSEFFGGVIRGNALATNKEVHPVLLNIKPSAESSSQLPEFGRWLDLEQYDQSLLINTLQKNGLGSRKIMHPLLCKSRG